MRNLALLLFLFAASVQAQTFDEIEVVIDSLAAAPGATYAEYDYPNGVRVKVLFGAGEVRAWMIVAGDSARVWTGTHGVLDMAPVAVISQGTYTPGSVSAIISAVGEISAWESLARFEALLRDGVSMPPDTVVAPPDTTTAPPDTTTTPPLACDVEPARLHADDEYEACLYAWMETLEAQDFVIPDGEDALVHWDGTYHDIDHLYNLYLAQQGWARGKWPDDVFYALPEWFTVGDDTSPDGIESDTIRYARWANNAADWTTYDMPNADGSQANPFYQSRALCLRALVVAAVDMIESDYYHTQRDNPWAQSANIKADGRFLGGLLKYWAHTLTDCGGEMPEDARAHFEAGLVHHLGKMRTQSAGANTPNMKSRAVAAAAGIYALTDDVAVKEEALELGRRFTFGYNDGEWLTRHHAKNALVYAAGYFQEGLSPETTYGGVTLYNLMEARIVGGEDWSWLDPALEAYLRWRNHQIFVEPSGFAYGPSGYAGRTGAGVDKLQAQEPWSSASAAALYEGGHVMINAETHPTRDLMISRMQAWLGRPKTIDKYFAPIQTRDMDIFRIDNQHHWPADVPYYPPSGSFDALSALVASFDPGLTLPMARAGYYYNESYADDFWMAKVDARTTGANQDFSFVVETEADGGTYGGYRGGSLQGFATETGGVFLMARKNKDSRDFSEIGGWPTHHVWGKDLAGQGFSTSTLQLRDVTYYGDVDSVSVGGTVGAGRQEVFLPIDIENRFILLPNGLRLRHVIESESVEVSELWLTLPVHLRLCRGEEVTRDTYGQMCGIPDATIEYESGGQWLALPDTLTAASTDGSIRLRIGRDWTYIGGGVEYAYVECQGALGVKRGPLWQQTYQGTSRIVPLHFRVGGGTGEPLPSEVVVTCDVTAA